MKGNEFVYSFGACACTNKKGQGKVPLFDFGGFGCRLKPGIAVKTSTEHGLQRLKPLVGVDIYGHSAQPHST